MPNKQTGAKTSLQCYIRFFPVITDITACPTLRSKPCLVVGTPTLCATFAFSPLMPTARLSEKDSPFILFDDILRFEILGIRHSANGL